MRRPKKTNAQRMELIIEAQLKLIEERAASGAILDLKDIEALKNLSSIMKDLSASGAPRQGKGFHIRPDDSKLSDEELEAYARGE